MKQCISSGDKFNLTNGTFVGLASTADASTAWNGVETRIPSPMPTAGKARKLSFKLTNAPGPGESQIFMLRAGGGDTSQTLTISGTDTSGTSAGIDASIAAGTLVNIGVAQTASPAASGAHSWAIELESDTANESIYLANSLAATLNASAVRYLPLWGNAAPDDTEADVQQIISVPGTLKKMFFTLEGSPGAGKSYVAQSQLNGDPTGCPVVTISGTDTSGSDTSTTKAVTAGQKFSYMITPSGTPTTRRCGLGIVLSPTTDGQSCCAGGSPGSISNSSTRYGFQNGTYGRWTSTSDILQCLTLASSLVNWYMALDVAPGAGKSWVFTQRVNAATPASGLVVTISGTDTTGNDIAHAVALNDLDWISLMSEPSGTPTNMVRAYWGITRYIAPAIGGVPWVYFHRLKK